MGTIEGSKIQFAHTYGSQNEFTWYCQQHAKYDQKGAPDVSSSFDKLKIHIQTEHGNVEQ